MDKEQARSKNVVSGVESNLVKSHGAGTYYGIWLKHLTLLHAAGMTAMPKTVVEIGPGATIGVGIAALLCGAESYFGLDLISHVDLSSNLPLVDQIADMLARRAPVKNAVGGFPNYGGYLDDRGFPAAALTDEQLARTLAPERVGSIRIAVCATMDRPLVSGLRAAIIAPWEEPRSHQFLLNKADLIISHSTMEHVSNIERAYTVFGQLVSVGGWMSHQVDFRSHGFSKIWNGYRGISDDEWSIKTSGSPYSINREPASRHFDLARKNGFEIVTLLSRMESGGLQRSQLTSHFINISDYDLRCSGIFFQTLRCQ